MIYEGLKRRTALATAITSVAMGKVVAAEQAEDTSRAPFGLTWGMTTEEVKKIGATLSELNDKNRFGLSFTAAGLGSVLSDIEAVVLSFGFRDRLFRVVGVGRSQGPDPYGGAVLSRYVELSRILQERYGQGKETDTRDTRLWKEPSEYVMALSQGRANRYITFQTATTDVELSVRANDSDHAYYILFFTNRPGTVEFDADNRRQEREAL
jgi:hypothetical protein